MQPATVCVSSSRWRCACDRNVPLWCRWDGGSRSAQMRSGQRNVSRLLLASEPFLPSSRGRRSRGHSSQSDLDPHRRQRRVLPLQGEGQIQPHLSLGGERGHLYSEDRWACPSRPVNVQKDAEVDEGCVCSRADLAATPVEVIALVFCGFLSVVIVLGSFFMFWCTKRRNNTCKHHSNRESTRYIVC